eukprot:3145710-Rhodomonas_salina.2
MKVTHVSTLHPKVHCIGHKLCQNRAWSCALDGGGGSRGGRAEEGGEEEVERWHRVTGTASASRQPLLIAPDPPPDTPVLALRSPGSTICYVSTRMLRQYW